MKLAKRELDILLLRNTSLEDSDSLPKPGVLAEEIAEDLETALSLFNTIATKLKG